MEALLEGLGRHWPTILTPLGVLLAALLVALVLRALVSRGLRRWAAHAESKQVDTIIKLLPGPVFFWTLLLGIYLSAEFLVLLAGPDDPAWPRLREWIGQAVLLLFVASLTYTGSRIAVRLVRLRAAEDPSSMAVNSLTQNLVRAAVLTIGTLVVLSMLGVSITPFLTAIGVGGLAVALGLQDTLSNLFAGFWVSIAGQVRLGDYVKLDSGQEGYVVDVSWRTTSIRMLANNLVIVPNSKLAQAIIINYHLPEKRMSLPIPVSVGYECDPDHVERVLVEEAKKGVQEIPGLLADPAPFVRFIPGYGESSIDMTLICQVATFVDQYLAQSELRKRIFRRFRQEGIRIPFPARTVYLHQDSRPPAVGSSG